MYSLKQTTHSIRVNGRHKPVTISRRFLFIRLDRTHKHTSVLCGIDHVILHLDGQLAGRTQDQRLERLALCRSSAKFAVQKKHTGERK